MIEVRKRLDRVVQLNSSKLPMLSGICVINGIERKVEAFEVPKGTSGDDLSSVLLEQAYVEREYQLTDWMKR